MALLSRSPHSLRSPTGIMSDDFTILQSVCAYLYWSSRMIARFELVFLARDLEDCHIRTRYLFQPDHKLATGQVTTESDKSYSSQWFNVSRSRCSVISQSAGMLAMPSSCPWYTNTVPLWKHKNVDSILADSAR